MPFENAGTIDNQTFMDWSVNSYTDIFHDPSMFWVILLMVCVGVVWIKTRSMGPTLGVAIIGSGVFSQVMYSGPMLAAFMFFVVIGVAIVLFRLVMGQLGRV